ncbi:MAG TPA: nitrous oxide reductase family maturation protein NosD [Candidatus Limnocylindrales bacterium]|nr:nitrous oxide reductase family maturation protein NosD [Candidatus Limnocylindrales bacterium]
MSFKPLEILKGFLSDFRTLLCLWPKRIFLVVLLGLAGSGLPLEVKAKTLIVGPDEPFTSVQEALTYATPGDTIRVKSGIYKGNLILDKQVVLEGIDNPTLQGDGRGSVITVNADGCVVRGFIIEHSGNMLVDEDSGILLKSNGNRIEENKLRDVLFGIYFFGSSDNIVRGNVIHGRDFLEPGERGSGIHIWNATNNTIVGNTIKQARDGMYLQNAYKSILRGNRVSDLRYGLHYMFSDDNKFEENLFYNNVAGAAIMYSRRIEFRRNIFIHNRGFSSFGLLFQDSDDCLAEENLILDNAVGIFMEALRNSLFKRNLIAANDTAIQIFTSASGNVFQRNNFVDNLSPIQVIGKNTTTQWSHEGVGNYWSDYDGYDLDADGIGDIPFKIQNIFQYLEGNHPRLRLYLFSPASQALALAEKTFPVIEGSREFDFYPLMKPVVWSIQMPELDGGFRFKRYSLILPFVMLGVSITLIAKGKKR